MKIWVNEELNEWGFKDDADDEPGTYEVSQ